MEHLQEFHGILTSFTCFYNCDRPPMNSLAEASAHMRWCKKRDDNHMLTPDPAINLADNETTSNESESEFRRFLNEGVSELDDSGFKSQAELLLNDWGSLNCLENEFSKLLIPEPRPRKRGKKKKNSGKTDPNLTRAALYAKTQDLWYKSRRNLWNLIKNGQKTSNTVGKENEFFEYFRDSFTKQPQCYLENASNSYGSISILYRINKFEIQSFLNRKKRSSPGPDGLSPSVEIYPIIGEVQEQFLFQKRTHHLCRMSSDLSQLVQFCIVV
ncbi:hypothetical protein BLOT_007361 [Blomia tropicalis]|nr:hypothetical protein BLOT_007361 [Blomia tropicalis]